MLVHGGRSDAFLLEFYFDNHLPAMPTLVPDIETGVYVQKWIDIYDLSNNFTVDKRIDLQF